MDFDYQNKDNNKMKSKKIEKQPENTDSISLQIESWYTQWIKMERLYTEFAKRFGLSSSAMIILRIIYEQPTGCTQRSICENLFYPKQTVSGIIQTLIKKGLVLKEQSHMDRRNVILHVSKQGAVFAFRMTEKLQKAEEEAFKAILPKDRNKFTQVNEILTKELHKAMDI